MTPVAMIYANKILRKSFLLHLRNCQPAPAVGDALSMRFLHLEVGFDSVQVLIGLEVHLESTLLGGRVTLPQLSDARELLCPGALGHPVQELPLLRMAGAGWVHHFSSKRRWCLSCRGCWHRARRRQHCKLIRASSSWLKRRVSWFISKDVLLWQMQILIRKEAARRRPFMRSAFVLPIAWSLALTHI